MASSPASLRTVCQSAPAAVLHPRRDLSAPHSGPGVTPSPLDLPLASAVPRILHVQAGPFSRAVASSAQAVSGGRQQRYPASGPIVA